MQLYILDSLFSSHGLIGSIAAQKQWPSLHNSNKQYKPVGLNLVAAVQLGATGRPLPDSGVLWLSLCCE